MRVVIPLGDRASNLDKSSLMEISAHPRYRATRGNTRSIVLGAPSESRLRHVKTACSDRWRGKNLAGALLDQNAPSHGQTSVCIWRAKELRLGRSRPQALTEELPQHWPRPFRLKLRAPRSSGPPLGRAGDTNFQTRAGDVLASVNAFEQLWS